MKHRSKSHEPGTKVVDLNHNEASEQGSSMAGGLFMSRVQNQIDTHKKDRSKAATQLNAYMSYLKEDDQMARNRQEQITEEHQEENELDNTKRGLLNSN